MVASLVITIFQTLLFLIMGPSLLFFGCAARTVGIFVQAVLASGWLDIISAIKALEICNVFFAFSTAVMVFTGAVALAVAMIGNPKIDYSAKGMLLFYFLADTPMKLLSDILFKTLGGCESIGDPTLTFPHGQPLGPAPCNCDHGEFICALYLTKILTWLITFIGAYVGNRYWKIIGAASYAMAGALMTIKCYTELTMMITMEAKAPDDVVNTMSIAISAAELVLIYGFAVVGFLVQVNPGMVDYAKAVKDSFTSGEAAEIPTGRIKCLLCRCCRVWLRTLMRLDGVITKIIAAGQAATAIQKSNTATMLAAAKAEQDEADEDAKKAQKKEDAKAQKEISKDNVTVEVGKFDPDETTAQYVQIESLTNQKKDLETQLQELQQKYDNAKQDWQGQLQNKQAELDSLKQA